MKSAHVGRTAKLVGLDIALIVSALVVTFTLVKGPGILADVQGFWLSRVLPVTLLSGGLLLWRRLYAIIPRYIGFYDFLNAVIVGGLLGIGLRFVEFVVNPGDYMAWAESVLFGLLSCGLIAGVRMAKRVQNLQAVYRRSSSSGPRYLIVGVADAGETVFRELGKIGADHYTVVGFISDDDQAQGIHIHGAPVLGRITDIPEIAEKHEVTEILIAKPDVAPSELRRIFSFCAKTKARIRNLPSFSALVNGTQNALPFMRQLEVQDLLRRDSIRTDLTKAEKYVSGERVLITGGGGSIGSELARQVARLSPASLVLLGKGEGSIFEVEQELKASGQIQPSPVICDVRDRISLQQVFSTQYPSIVFHAAAHKHVPLMEAVPIEAIRNNIFGTLNVADAALKNGAKKFILVSTDKAVNPSNVMGATKRVAEMVVAALSGQGETTFSIVRFGNVLGSRGSLVPILKQQIAKGGPVTITHPDMTRYFMTIPEAAELIVQAGAMGDKGEIFVLDMGEPIKIIDLVNDTIRMHGLVPGQDIELKYVGIRPGEKIHEELFFDAEQVTKSGHDKIHLVDNPSEIRWDWLKIQLEELNRICESGDQAKAREFLMELAWAKNLPPVTAHTAL